MIGGVLVGSVLGMLVGAGCLIAGVPVLLSLAAWSGTGVLAVSLLVLWSLRPRGAPLPALRPQRS
jgi:hypothetical protein